MRGAADKDHSARKRQTRTRAARRGSAWRRAHGGTLAGPLPPLDLGVEPYLIAATLRGVLSQRLVRDEDGTGRKLVTQMMTMNDPLREAVSAGAKGRALAKLVAKTERFWSDVGFG